MAELNLDMIRKTLQSLHDQLQKPGSREDFVVVSRQYNKIRGGCIHYINKALLPPAVSSQITDGKKRVEELIYYSTLLMAQVEMAIADQRKNINIRPEDTSDNKYLECVKKIIKLGLASFAFTLFLNVTAITIDKLIGHPTAFDEAVKILIHYPESIKSIFAFFSATFFFLSVTLIIEPSDMGRFCRRWVFIPSLHISEHMLSLATGVFLAWAVTEFFSNGIPFNSPFQVFNAILLPSLILSGFAVFCAGVGVFLTDNFDSQIEKLGKVRYIILLCIPSLLIWAVLNDAVWNYKPGPTSMKEHSESTVRAEGRP